jgi:hypothetical protein
MTCSETIHKKVGDGEMGAMAFVPFLMMVFFYGFVIWFAVNLIKAQKERNDVLKEISNKLEGIQFSKKEE